MLKYIFHTRALQSYGNECCSTLPVQKYDSFKLKEPLDEEEIPQCKVCFLSPAEKGKELQQLHHLRVDNAVSLGPTFTQSLFAD